MLFAIHEVSQNSYFLVMLEDNHVCGCYVASCTLPMRALYCHITVIQKICFRGVLWIFIIWEQVRVLCKHLCGELVVTAARCQCCKMNTMLKSSHLPAGTPWMNSLREEVSFLGEYPYISWLMQTGRLQLLN